MPRRQRLHAPAVARPVGGLLRLQARGRPLGLHVRLLRRLIRLVGLAAQIAACSTGDDGARYLDDASFRRERLVASLVSTENHYAERRLARYATGRDGDWDRLPAWNPPAALVDTSGAATDPARALDLALPAASDGSARHAALVALGEAAFFRYPTQLVSGDLARLPRLVRVGFSDGTSGLAMTCATCHARIVDGTLAPGLADESVDLGWGPGKVDVADPSGEEPVAIPDLRVAALETHLHRDGTVRNDPIALAIRIETLITTSHDEVVRPPREVALALATYLASLAPPPVAAPAPGSAASRGQANFAKQCAGCHAGDGMSGPPVPLAAVGTDPRVGESADRGTGGYRIPSLRAVGTRGRLLHDASCPDLPTLFDPSRTAAIPGHPFGLALSSGDRADLLAFLSLL